MIEARGVPSSQLWNWRKQLSGDPRPLTKAFAIVDTLAKILGRGGLSVPRSTLCAMFHRVSESLLKIYERLLDVARADPSCRPAVSA